MSRTYRKKHFYTEVQMNRIMESDINAPLTGAEEYRILYGWSTPTQIEQRRARYVKQWKLLLTTDNGCKRWSPCKRMVKYFTRRKSRAEARNEMSKCYRDYDHYVELTPYNRCDDVWNWD